MNFFVRLCGMVWREVGMEALPEVDNHMQKCKRCRSDFVVEVAGG